MSRLGRGRPNRPIVVHNAAGVVGGSATISAAFVMAGSGTKAASGSATIAASFTLAGSGTKAAPGSATITATFTLAGSGTATTGIVSARPRPKWQFVAGPATGGYELSLTEAKSRKFTARLTDPDEIAFSIDGRHAQAAALDELTTDVHVLWTSPATGTTQVLSRGRVGPTGDTLDANTHQLDLTIYDYRAVLGRRILYSTDTLTYTATDQSAIAWGLIASTQAHTGGDLGISRGDGQITGITRDRTFEAGDPIGQRIDDLADLVDGFDWDVTPVGGSGLQFDVWSPMRGESRGVVLEYGGLVASLQRQVDVSDYGNALRMTGTGTLTAVESESADLASRSEGRWDVVIGDDSLTTQTALNDRAAWQLATSEVITPTYTLTLRQGAWDGPDHIWLGDQIQLIIMSGRLAVNTFARVYEIAFDIGGDGSETIQITVGGPRPDYRRKPRSVDRRLSTLERR